MIQRRTLAACISLAAPLLGHAQGLTFEPSRYFDNRWYITPFASYVLVDDDDRLSDDGWGGGLAIGKPVHPNWNVEFRFMYEELDSKTGGPGKYENWSGTVDAQWFFIGRQGLRVWEAGTVQPYLVGGIGAINDKIKGVGGGSSDDEVSATFNLGAGIVWPIAPWGRLVFDARYRWDDNRGDLASRNNFDDWLFTVGLQIPFGPAPMVAQAPPPPPPPPPPAPAPPPPPPPPPPAPVTRTFDLSADGMFAFGKASLTDIGRSRIDNMLQGLKSAGITARSVTIIGYTDPIGTEEANQRLSTERANVVRDYMVNKGVPAGVIRAEGRGESNPKVTEADCKAKGSKSRSALIECLTPNRRVEVQATGDQRP